MVTFTPQPTIDDRFRLARMLQAQAGQGVRTTSSLAPIANALQGIAGGLNRGAAETALQGNQQVTQQALQAAASAPDNLSLARALAGSQNPDLALQGVSLTARARDQTQSRAIQQERLNLARQAQARENARLAQQEQLQQQQAAQFGQLIDNLAQTGRLSPEQAALLRVQGPEAGAKLAGEQLFPESEGRNAPSGFRFTPEGNLEAIPGGPAARLPAEVAGRVALAEVSLNDLPKVREVFDRISPGEAALGQFEAGEIGQAQRSVTAGIEAALRLLTGAAAPDSEVRRYERIFMPRTTDRASTRKQKLDLLENFMRSAVDNATAGRGGSQPTGVGRRVVIDGFEIEEVR